MQVCRKCMMAKHPGIDRGQATGEGAKGRQPQARVGPPRQAAKSLQRGDLVCAAIDKIKQVPPRPLERVFARQHGEVGEVVVTTLNPDYPLIRFATGDMSAVMPLLQVVKARK